MIPVEHGSQIITISRMKEPQRAILRCPRSIDYIQRMEPLENCWILFISNKYSFVNSEKTAGPQSKDNKYSVLVFNVWFPGRVRLIKVNTMNLIGFVGGSPGELRMAMGEISNFYNFSHRLLIFGTHIPPITTIHAAKFQ